MFGIGMKNYELNLELLHKLFSIFSIQSLLKLTSVSALIFVFATLSGCDMTSDGTGFPIGGSVSGLSGTLVLQNNRTDAITLSVNGPFAFPTRIKAGSKYNVTVRTQPIGQACAVMRGTGSSQPNVTDVTVICQTAYSVGGTIIGLSGTVVLQNSGGDNLTLNSTSLAVNGAFTFPSLLPSGANYSVIVSSQSANQTCSVGGGDSGYGSGSILNSRVSNVSIICQSAYSIGGVISGLVGTVVLQNNGRDDLTLTTSNYLSSLLNSILNLSSAFTFQTSLVPSSSYAVTVKTQPIGQICTVSNDSGTGLSSNVSNISVSCASVAYSVSGVVEGLPPNSSSFGTLTLKNTITSPDGSTITQDYLPITSTGAGSFPFTFPISLSASSTYVIGFKTQPNGYSCSAKNGNGTVIGTNITNVTIACNYVSYSLKAVVSGLGGGSLVLSNNSSPFSSPITANGLVTLVNNLPSGSGYAVGVFSQPNGYNCSVGRASGTVVSSDIVNISVFCSPATYKVGATIAGLTNGTILNLTYNGSPLAGIGSSGAVNLASGVSTGASYVVGLLAQPNGLFCSVLNGAGTLTNGDIADIKVNCKSIFYSLKANLTGLTSGVLVLSNNGSNLPGISYSSNNSSVSLVSNVPTLSNYLITVATQPNGFNCTVANGSGQVTNLDVTNINISCLAVSYSLKANVSGLINGQLILSDNNVNLPVTINASGLYTLASKVPTLTNYAIGVASSPPGYSCSVSPGSGSGTVTNSDITNISVSCSVVTYSVNATVRGLSGGMLTLSNSGVDLPVIASSGSVVLATNVNTGTAYQVTISTQPNGYKCLVSNGVGTVVGSNISNIAIDCSSTTYSLTGTVIGLSSGSFALSNNGIKLGSVTPSGGSIAFASGLITGSTYSLSVATQPNGFTCSVSNPSGPNPSGQITNSDITDITVSCSPATYNIKAIVSGSMSGTLSLTNGSSSLPVINALGTATLVQNVAAGTSYNVKISSQPAGYFCSITPGTEIGVVTNADVTSIIISCKTTTYSVTATVIGLVGLSSGYLAISNNGNNIPSNVTTNGVVNIASYVPTNSVYSIAVATQPNGYTCAVYNGVGTISNSDINATINCVSGTTYTVGATVSGLTGSLTLNNNGANSTTVTTNGAVILTSGVITGTAYQVKISSQPNGQTCTVTNGGNSATTLSNENINSIINCVSGTTYTVGATVSGLTGSLTLNNNGANSITLNANGPANLTAGVNTGSPYSIKITSQPNGQTCTVNGGGPGTLSNSNISANITCLSGTTYGISASVSGLPSGGGVPFALSLIAGPTGGTDTTSFYSVSNNGTVSFGSSFPTNTSYKVAVATQPNGYRCEVSNATGSITNSNSSGASVTCTGGVTYSLSASVSGLGVGTSVGLSSTISNLTSSSSVTGVGAGIATVQLGSMISSLSSYSVSIANQPNGYNCKVSSVDGAGTVTNSDLSVTITCSQITYSLSAVVYGLSSGTLILSNSTNSSNYTVTGSATSPQTISLLSGMNTGVSYGVSVTSQPNGYNCTSTGGSGSVTNANVSIAVNCVSGVNYSVSATVSGLGTGNSVTLTNNGSNPVTVGQNGQFVLSSNSATGAPYSVAVSSQPNGQTCTVSGVGTSGGTITNSNINATVTCAGPIYYSVSANVLGLGGGQLSLSYNGALLAPISSNGAILIASGQTTGTSYVVQVVSQPNGYLCTINGNGQVQISGTLTNADVNNVSISCQVVYYKLQVALSGLTSGTVTLSSTTSPGGTTTVANLSNGVTTIASNLTSGTSYVVTLSSQPNGMVCSVSNGTGSIVNQDITNLSVSCSPITTGAVSGWTVKSGAALFTKMAVDQSGNIYAVGTTTSGTSQLNFGNGVTLGASTWTSAALNSGHAGFLVKYNSQGVAQWAKTSDAQSVQVWFNGVAVDQNNGVYVVGWVYGAYTVAFNGKQFRGYNSGDNAIFIKFDATTGAAQWVNYPAQSGTTALSHLTSVSVDQYGTAFCTGWTTDGAVNWTTPNGGSYVVSTGTSGGWNHSPVVVVYNAFGQSYWEMHPGISSGWAEVADAVYDWPNNAAYYLINLSFNGKFSFGTSPTVQGASKTGKNPILMKIAASNGGTQWIQTTAGGNGDFSLNGLAVDSLRGNIFAAGSLKTGPTYSFSGAVQGASFSVPAWSINNVANGATASLSTNAGNGAYNSAIVSFDSSGNPNWFNTVSTTASNSSSSFNGVSVDASGAVFAYGSIQGQGNTFYFSNNSPGVTAAYSYDSNSTGAAVVVKYDAYGNVFWASSESGYSPGGSSFVTGAVVPGFGFVAAGNFWGAGTYDMGNAVSLTTTTAAFNWINGVTYGFNPVMVQYTP